MVELGKDVTVRKVSKSDKRGHHLVFIGDPTVNAPVGELWQEEAHVLVSKMTEPRRTAKKIRWFSRVTGSSSVFGKGDRVALMLGAGFSSRGKALETLLTGMPVDLAGEGNEESSRPRDMPRV